MKGGSIVDPCGRKGGSLVDPVGVIAFLMAAAVFATSASGQDLKLGPGGCPVPWSVEWCVSQAGEDARSACASSVPAPTSRGCLAKMKAVNRAATQAAEARAKAQRFEMMTAPRALGVTALKRGIGYTPRPGSIAKWQAIGGGCPDWLAVLGNPRGCTRRVDFSAIDPALESAPCGPNSGSNGTTPQWVAARYGKPNVGGFLPPANELFSSLCDHLATQPVAPGYDGIPNHREAYDCMAVHCWGGVVVPPPPANRCGDRSCLAPESCSTCSVDCGQCPPPPPPLAVCGDGSCNGTETCTTCERDCKSCPASPPATKTYQCHGKAEVSVGLNSTGKLVNLLTLECEEVER